MRGPAIDRGDRRLFASPREHSVAIGGKPNWVTVVAGKNCPAKVLSYVSFAGTSRSTVIFQSVCTDTSDLELVIGDRFLGTLKTPLEPVNVHFRQHVVATIVIAVETWRVSSFNKS